MPKTTMPPQAFMPCGRNHANCNKCGLFVTGCRSPFMQGYGPEGGIVVVGEAPGKQEDDQGRAFVGASGKMIRKALAARGIDPSRVYWTNAVRCRPPNNKTKATHVSQCRPFLLDELARVRPKAVLLVGNSALMSVLKRGGILKQRRHAITLTLPVDGGAGTIYVPCVACLHPAYIMRAQDMLPEFEGDLDFFAATVREHVHADSDIVDSTKLKKVAHVRNLAADVPVNTQPTLADVQAFADMVRKRDLPVGYDTETDTLRPYVERDFSLLCVGVSAGDRTLVVQCDVPRTPTVDAVVDRYGADPAETKRKLRVILDLLRDANVRKVAHNGKYDYHVIKSRFNIPVRNLWVDTRILHAFLYSIEGVAHDLDSVIASVLGAWKYKHITSAWVGESESNPKKFLTVPYEALATRNGLDCYGTLTVVKPMLRELKAYTKRWSDIAEIKRTGPWDLFFKLIMPMAASLMEMEARGMEVNMAYLDQFSAQLAEEIRAAAKSLKRNPAIKAYEAARRADVLAAAKEQKRYPRPDVIRSRIEKSAFNPNSRDQVADVLVTSCGLQAAGIPLVYTETKKVGTSEEALASYAAHAMQRGMPEAATLIADVQAYAAAAKGRGTFVEGMRPYIDANHRVHTSYNQDIARTGRLSSSEPNLQNIPIRGREGKDDLRYRRMFIAREGSRLISADYSQVELRVLAALGRDEFMSDIFRRGRDLHTETARRAFGIPDGEDVPKSRRREAKTVNFGVVYQQTAVGLAASLGCSEADATNLIDLIMRQMPGATRWISRIKRFARKHGIVYTWFGRPRLLGNATLGDNDGGLVSHAERRAVNTPVQGTANEICEIAFHAASKYFTQRVTEYSCRPVAIVHDQILFECDADYVDVATPIIYRLCIDGPTRALGPEFIVPLHVDLSIGDNWGDLIDVELIDGRVVPKAKEA